MKETMNIGDNKTISTCKRTTRSTWANKDRGSRKSRNTDKGMRMVVSIEKNSKGQKVSNTSFVSSK